MSSPAGSGKTADLDSEGAPPEVPGFQTWRGVYLFVLAAFVAVVVVLALLARLYA